MAELDLDEIRARVDVALDDPQKGDVDVLGDFCTDLLAEVERLRRLAAAERALRKAEAALANQENIAWQNEAAGHGVTRQRREKIAEANRAVADAQRALRDAGGEP